MVVRVCERAQASGARSVTVATDDARIVDAAGQHGFRALMTSAAHASGTDRLAEAARKLRLRDSDIVVNVQGDEPLISPSLIRQVGGLLSKKPRASVSTACHAIHRDATNPNVVKVVLDREGYALYFSRSQIPYPREAGAAVYRHAGIYGYRVSFLKKYARLKPAPLEKVEALEQLRVLWHGYRIAVVVSKTEIPPGVDTPQDLDAVRRMFQ
jgi:3-deoxy-manno-octulosonate cytidylyltransferase (CMP-KDO synthetase)